MSEDAPKHEFRTLRIFMRSGNVIEGNTVTEWTARYRGNQIVGLDLTQGPGPGSRIRPELLDFLQIEGVVEVFHD